MSNEINVLESESNLTELSANSVNDRIGLIPDAGMFDLERIELPPSGWKMAIVPAMVAWLGSVSFIGQYRVNDVTASLDRILFGSLREIFLGTIVFCLAACAISIKRKKFGYCVLWSTVAGYLAGHEPFARLPVHDSDSWNFPFQEMSHGIGFAWQRLAYGLCVGGSTLTCLLVSSHLTGQRTKLFLRIGNWRAWGRDFTHRSKPETYWQSFFGFMVFSAVLFLVVQMSVELKPLRQGTLVALLPALAIAALANAFIEELIYRGVLQSAFVAAAGLARGIWICSMMFGLLHWGLSVGALAALPVSIVLGVGSVFWGKSLRETGGITWAIAVHSLVDLAIMSAYFVPIDRG